MTDGKYFLFFDSQPIKLFFDLKDILAHVRMCGSFVDVYIDVFDEDGDIIKTYAADEFLERYGS